jgi:hypothetical protein
VKYAVAIWTAIWAAAGVVYAVHHGGAPTWMFTVAAACAVAAVFLRDRWRAKYLDLKASRPQRLPSPAHTVRVIGHDDRPTAPQPRQPPDDDTREWPAGGPWQP